MAKLDTNPWINARVGRLRRRLPGDHRFGDPLSIRVADPLGALAQMLSELSDRSVCRQLGLATLQLWRRFAPDWMWGAQSTRDVAGAELEVPGESVTTMFTDLSGFSEWALQVGDEAVVELLREISAGIEPLLEEHGRVVKRLGDGLMVVFDDAQAATSAAIRSRDRVEDEAGYRHGLHLRAGVHTGQPVALGGDYFGRDVNIAARLAAAAAPGEVLVSTSTRGQLTVPLALRRVPFRAKGVPAYIGAYKVRPTEEPRLKLLTGSL